MKLLIDSDGAKLPKSCHECFACYGGMCFIIPSDRDEARMPEHGKPDWCPIREYTEPTKFQIKTTLSNVDIPKGIDEEQFFAVLSNQYAALAKLYVDDVPVYGPSGEG